MASIFGRLSVAVVTPFLPFEKATTLQAIDFGSFAATVAHVACGLQQAKADKASDIGGIIVTGTTGEQHSTTVEERMTLYRDAVTIASTYDIPVIAGIAATTSYAAASLALSATASGCQGIMLGLPPYLRPNDAELTSYVRAVYDSTSLPILLYNNSVRNGSEPSVDTLLSWYRNGYIYGIKHAVSPEHFNSIALSLLEKEPNLPLYTGSDAKSYDLFVSSRENASIPTFYGLTSIIANLYPYQIACMVSDMHSSNSATQQRGTAVYHRMLPVINACLSSTVPVGLKYAMRLKLSTGGYARSPLGDASLEIQSSIREAIQTFEGSEA